MAEPKKKQGTPSGSASPTLEELEKLSTLQLLDWLAMRGGGRAWSPSEYAFVRDRIAGLEEMNDQARQAIEKLDAAVDQLRAPALRAGTFLESLGPKEALVCVGGSDYLCQVDPDIAAQGLQIGERVLCNQAFAVVRALGFDRSGPIVRVEDVLSDGRIRIGQDATGPQTVVVRSALLSKDKIKPGVEIRLDPFQRVALEVVGVSKRIHRVLESVPEIPWSAIGGQEEAVSAIRDAMEMPFLHRDLFKAFDHAVPKGFLLYGPPGCGKTLLGKAAAYNLRRQHQARTGQDRPEFFLHIKGPEILNMWVGESERQVRDLFAQCREKAREGALAFLFIDEAESLLGTRHGGRFHHMSSTMVPMFCAEMDGLEPLQNVVVMLASNRADLIDPAILRPGRVDRKIRVRRPDEAGARAIYALYLKEGLPLAEPREVLAAAAAECQFARTESREFLEVTYRSGRRDVLYQGDLASGAIIAAIVERAKGAAIKRSVELGVVSPLTREDLLQSLDREYGENDLFPANDLTEDWLKLTDFDPHNVVRLGPVRPRGATELTVSVV